MSKLLIACALALVSVPTPARAADKASAEIQKRLAQKATVPADLSAPVSEVLAAVSKSHDLSFVIVDEEFRALGAQAVASAKSRVTKLNQTDATVAAFLDVWLGGVGATYRVRPDYVEIVPIRAARAGDKEPAKRDSLEVLLAALETETTLREGLNVNEIPLFELLQDLSKRHGISFVILEKQFAEAGDNNVRENKPNVTATNLRGLSVRQLLNVVFDGMNATYLVRNNRIEIVPLNYAAGQTKSQIGDGGKLAQPLVSLVVKEKPLNETVAKFAETYELNVFVSPQAGDARTAFVSARLMNVPADKALELLALQADLRVVKKGNAFLLTSKDHADGLVNEKQDRERQKIELEKLREVPPAQPKPEPPAPQPKM